MASVWKGQLCFGLVTFPCKLSAGARTERVSFNQLHEPCLGRIKQQIFCPTCDKTVKNEELVKGYEHEKDQYVVCSADDLKRIAPQSSQVMEVMEFVRAGDVDPLYLETGYYMAPDKGGEKAYALLYTALIEADYCAIAKLCMHQREHVVIIRPGVHGLRLFSMFYQDEVKADVEYRTDVKAVSRKELDLAKMLIEARAAEFDPEKYSDAYRTAVMEFIEAKKSGKAMKKVRPISMPKVSSIEDALMASLGQLAPKGKKAARRAS